jgi:hypothetical protein
MSDRLHREFAAIVLAVATVGCGNGGGDDGVKSFSFLVATDAPCYGASVHVDLTVLASDAVPAGEIPCRLASDLPVGCAADFSRSETALDLAVRGCLLADDSTLVECDLDADNARAVTAATTVACGCGCQDVCPMAPSVCAYVSDGAGCTPAPPSVPATNAPGSRGATVTEVIAASTTTTTYCGTCCDVVGSAQIMVGDSEPIMELYVTTAETIYFQTGCYAGAYCTDLSGTAGPGFARVDGDEVAICVSSATPFVGPLTLAQCDIVNGGISQPGLGRVVRALDRNYRPLAIPPAISVGYPD